MLLYSIELKEKMKNIRGIRIYGKLEYKENQAYKKDEEREEHSDVTLYRFK